MNAAEIKAMLVNRVEDVCALLLPGGKRRGAEWVCGSLSGEAGTSLQVHLVGDKAGVWADFAQKGEQGGIIDLWMKVRQQDFATAIRDIRLWLGIGDREPEFARPRATPKKFVRPAMDTVEPLQSAGEVFDYLTKTRGLFPEVLNAYRVGQMATDRGPVIVFPAYDPAGRNVDLLKFLAVRRDANGKKHSWSSPDSKDHLIGWQCVTPHDRQIVITEGEIDAYTVAGWGPRALSIPRGVKAMDWIEHDYESLDQFERIYLCTDTDAAGHACAQEIAHRLGRTRCFRIHLPFKDANEAHLKGFSGEEFYRCMDAARTIDPEELRNLGDMEEEIFETIHPSNPKFIGTEPPFDIPWRCKFGEVTIWSGWSGHGKSHLLNQFLLHDAHQGEKICIASLEMRAGSTGARIVKMILKGAPEKENREALKPAIAILSERFWVVDRVGVIHWRKLIPILEYAARRYGCTRFAVDSLLRLGIAEDDYNQQKECVENLVMFAAEYGHVHLVCHARKADDESKAPGKLDVRGAAAITDLVQNGFTVWRNKEKEQKVEEAQHCSMSREEKEKWYQMADAQLTMWKNREDGDEPFRKLWLHRTSGQFYEKNRKIFEYLPTSQ